MQNLCVVCLWSTSIASTVWELEGSRGGVVRVDNKQMQELMLGSEDWYDLANRSMREYFDDIQFTTGVRLNYYILGSSGIFARVFVRGSGYCAIHSLDCKG